MTTRTVLVIEPDPIATLDRFDAWLTEHGVTAHIVRPHAGDAVPTIADYAGVIVLGGRMSAHDADEYPWLLDIFALIRDAADRATPSLGICLGAQLISQALGGEVLVGAGSSEVGAVTIRTVGTDDDPLLQGLGTELLVAEDHRDMISRLPDGATRLAGSDDYQNQVFRVGDVMWGVQFHPEVSVPGFRGWIDDAISANPTAAPRLESTMAAFEAADPVIRQTAAVIAERFAGVVRTRADTGSTQPET
ncbi:type 1 glutamine amidotransferase [Gordonia sp. NB41Y]|uniref:type 1 glutamine amidotransferase n=1 Tax=Gordonia sp. NB41Y TaxID=875808 RepID=UPI0002BFCF57|nr:type 1 glutamine amidotransferase [Gordonia sp. NB41Y]WLP92188.1 type 1 glutamine amidotransferase [Gordonia sp. NB41Y]